MQRGEDFPSLTNSTSNINKDAQDVGKSKGTLPALGLHQKALKKVILRGLLMLVGRKIKKKKNYLARH